jgi:exosortase
MSATTLGPIIAKSARFRLAVLIGLYWAQLLIQLQTEWTANAQYGFGLFVPVIVIVLLWRQWRNGAEHCLGYAPGEEVESRKSQLAFAVGMGLLGLVLPLRLLEEANVGWRSVQWLHALILVFATLAVLWRVGGWRWMRQFAFPILFLLVAVPWPSRPELRITQYLMGKVMVATVEIVGLLGVPALRHGYVLEIGSGLVDIDGACSGIRSLQTSLMLALLLGELYRLNASRRLLLVGSAVLIAVLANIGRTSFLTWTAAKHGLVSMSSLHGPAGLAIVFIVLTSLTLLAYLLSRHASVFCPVPSSGRTQNSDPCSSAPAYIASGSRRQWSGVQFSGRYLFVGFAWLLFTETATAVWFGIGDSRARTNPVWVIKWPLEAANYSEWPFSKPTLDILRCDTSRNGSWRDGAGNIWSFMAFRWGPHNRNSFIGKGHSPDQCFTAAGWHLCDEPEPVRLNVNGVDFPFCRYKFEIGGQTAYVFLTLWDERSPDGKQEWPLADGFGRRLEAAFAGKRHQGLKKLEISIIGPAASEEVLSLLQKELEKLILVEKRPAEKVEGRVWGAVNGRQDIEQ